MRKEYDILPIFLIEKLSGKFLHQMSQIQALYRDLDFICVHIDADDANETKVLESRWNPWLEEAFEPEKWIPIIPVYKMENWIIGAKITCCDILDITEQHYVDILQGRRPENIADPKKVLERLTSVSEVNQSFDIYGTFSGQIEISELSMLRSFKLFVERIAQGVSLLEN